ncbi:hypothetical protein cypCar_00035295 [Cyprinus carpio]|nr:hypothetical protein cypCar_00035295 [Cyprinus carpio]
MMKHSTGFDDRQSNTFIGQIHQASFLTSKWWDNLLDLVNLEFMRITTVPLISKFIGQLDKYTDALMKVFRHKGGCAGQKIRTIMALTAK